MSNATASEVCLQAMRRGEEVSFAEWECPEPGAGEVVLDVLACGICGTDLHAGDNSSQTWQPFGHEVVGRVSKTWGGEKKFTKNDIVALDSSTPCGACDNCRNARQELCTDIQSIYFLKSFGFADKIHAPSISAMKCGDLDPAVATLQEPLGVALDLVRVSDIQPGSNVLILGQGPIGLMAVSLCRRAGARRVFVSDFESRTARKEAALEFGADAYLDPEKINLEEYNFGCKLDRILVTAPPRTLNTAFAIAAKGAIIGFIGIAHGDGAFCRFDANAFHFKKLQLRSSFASPALFGALALDLLREKVIDGDRLVTHRIPLSRLAEGLKIAAEDPEAIKVVAIPDSLGM